MRQPRSRLALAPGRQFGGRSGQEAILESEIANIVAKRPLPLAPMAGRGLRSRAEREAASRQRQAAHA